MTLFIVLVAVLWAGTGWAECIESNTADGGLSVNCPSPGQMTLGDEDISTFSLPHFDEEFHFTSSGILQITKESLDALLKDNPDASLKVAVYEYDEHREVLDRARPAPCLERMEAAMRAMEPWLLDHAPFAKTSDFQRDKALFLEVKRDCWQHEGGKP